MNDPRTTAYALGQLDAPERETFEKDLAHSSELQSEINEIIALAEALPAALDSDDCLTEAQRNSLRLRYADNRRALRREIATRRRLVLAGIGAIAAGLIVTAILSTSNHDAPQVAAPGAVAIVPVKPITVPAPAPIATPAAAPTPNPQVADRLAEAKKFAARGSYELATRRYNAVLAIEPANAAAQAGLKGMATAPRPTIGPTASLENRSGKRATASLGSGTREASNSAKKSTSASVWANASLSTGWDPLSNARSEQRTDADAPKVATADKNAENHTFLAGNSTNAAPAASKMPVVGDTPLVGRLNHSENADAAQVIGGVRAEATYADANIQNKDEDFALQGTQSKKFTISLNYGAQRSEYTIDLQPASPDGESYTTIRSNPFLDALSQPLSTFSIDVDTASYANVRRFLADGQLPPPDAVRIEELVNYFPYDYPQPDGDAPFSVNTEVSRAPWDSDMLLARVALKGRDIPADKLPPSNLVFLIDVSGSMASENKLPLLQRSLVELVKKLSPNDHVAIVTYAGDSGVALRSTSGEEKSRIQRAIRNLDAGGSTNGAAGIELAYEIARKNFIEEGNNRVILCTDGDFNVGVTGIDALTRIIERERKSNVFLSVLGFGTSNLKDSTMEMLADKGNGNYAYIDTFAEGRKVLVEQMRANLFTIAKDVKIQIEFNPTTVAGYRLIGYENRLLAKEDFNNDRKDAGEIGAGHTVTALYEIVPAGQSFPGSVDPLKYQPPAPPTAKPSAENSEPASPDLFTVKLRYKEPDGDKSNLIEKTVDQKSSDFESASADFRFATAVAAFGMKLRPDEGDPTLDWSEIQKIARTALGEDPESYRAEFLTLIKKAKELSHEEE